MRTKLALIVLLLVILPTAVLSILAGRVLRNWEIILQRRLETGATAAISEVSDRLRTKLVDDLSEVRVSMADCLGRGGSHSEIARAAHDLTRSKALVAQVYLFMNPLGFVYPERRKKLQPDMKVSRLIEVLRQKIALGGGAGPLVFVVDDAVYCFSHLRNRKGLYAGYRAAPEAFNRQLSSILSWLSGGDFVLSAEGPGIAAEAAVVVTDSFSSVSGDDGGAIAVGMERAVLHSSRLARPFDFIEVTAHVDDPDKLKRAGQWQVRFYGWGLVLVVGAVVAGGWLIVRQAALEIQRARQRSDFVVGVSHDLRTPVASMKMLAESLYLKTVADPKKQQQFLGAIVAECDRLADTIERILFFVRQEQKALVYSFEPLGVGLLVRSAVEVFEQRVLDKSEAGTHKLMNTVISDKLPKVSGDWNALTKVVLNLLDNAVKYGTVASDGSELKDKSSKFKAGKTERAHGGGDVRIQINVDKRILRGREWVRIVVRDRGMGISLSEQKKIFRKFYRANPETHKDISGVGLGLALCRDIVAAHKGRIEVESEPGKGSTFTVLLPVG